MAEDPIGVKPHKTFSSFGPGEVVFHDDKSSVSEDSEITSAFRALVKPFVIKQWLYHGKIYREKRERIPSRFELFFDLVFVAIAHQLSDTAAEHASVEGFVQFLLTFYPTWSLWSEFRAFVNASGTDDLLQRVGILYMMAILLGYTANASAITLGQLGSDTGSTGGTNTTEAVVRAIFAAEDSGSLGLTSVEKNTRDPAVVATTIFYLLGRSLRMIFLFVYAMVLPRFRVSLLIQFLLQTILFILYIPLLVISSTPVIITLASLGIAIDIIMRYFVGFYRILFPDRPRHHSSEMQQEKGKSTTDIADFSQDCVQGHDREMCAHDKEEGSKGVRWAVPALNIEHFLERTAAFVVIVLGEMVMNVVYHATSSEIGFKRIYGNAICGLIIAFNLCWLYFDAECSQRFTHAIRRHWFSSLTFTTLHYPLCASLILVSAAMSRITPGESDVGNAIRWYFGGGLGCAIISMAGIGFTHKGLDPAGTTRIGRHIMLGFRIAVGIIMACLPLAKSLTSLKLMGTCTALTSFLVIEEVYGRLCRQAYAARENQEEEEERQDEILESPQEEYAFERSEGEPIRKEKDQ